MSLLVKQAFLGSSSKLQFVREFCSKKPQNLAFIVRNLELKIRIGYLRTLTVKSEILVSAKIELLCKLVRLSLSKIF